VITLAVRTDVRTVGVFDDCFDGRSNGLLVWPLL